MRVEEDQKWLEKWLESQFLDAAPAQPANAPETANETQPKQTHQGTAPEAPRAGPVSAGNRQERSQTVLISEQAAPGYRSTVVPETSPVVTRAERHPAPKESPSHTAPEGRRTEPSEPQDVGDPRLSLPLDFVEQEIAPPAGRFLRPQEAAPMPAEAPAPVEQPAAVVISEVDETAVAGEAPAATVEAVANVRTAAEPEPAAEEAMPGEEVAEETAAAVAQEPPLAEDVRPAVSVAAQEPILQAPVVPQPPQASGSPPASASKRRGRALRSAQPAERLQPMDPERLWSLVPRHIQTLLAMDPADEEIAQNSYKRPFRESRLELIQRLLDPTLSLEDTARLLNVCPTTVRRHTNRGLLRHQRTPGDQRRFKLSDVLAFLEAQSKQNGS